MVITESELRQLWQDGRNALPVFPPGTRFTPAAVDFLKNHQLEIPVGEPPACEGGLPTAERPAWDRPGEFPVVLSGSMLVLEDGGALQGPKPDHMTQLDAVHFAPKTHPRIRLRGQVDTLHALCMLTAAQARSCGLNALAECLDSLSAYCREMQSADYNNRPIQPLQVGGHGEEDIHAISHHPEKHLGIPHIVPGPNDVAIIHWLNMLRAFSRQVELTALEVYPPPQRSDLVRSFNRFSSAVYVLELWLRCGKLA